MEINFNEIKENIKVNGISFHSKNQAAYNYIVTAIGLYRMRYNNTEIMKNIEALAKNDDYAMGRRFLDNEMVAVRLLSAINSSFRNVDVNLDEESGKKIVNTFVQSLSGQEMDAFILESLRDCASADHWYMYEKQWD